MTRTNFILAIYILTAAFALFSGYLNFQFSMDVFAFGLSEIIFVIFVTLSSPLLLKQHRFNYKSAAPYLLVWSLAFVAVAMPHILQPEHFHGQHYPLIITLLILWLFIPFSENLNALGPNFSRKFVVAMSLIAILYSAIFMIFYSLGVYAQPTENPLSILPGFGNVRLMGHIVAPMLALGFVVLAGISSRTLLFWFYVVGLPILLSLLLWSSSRSGTLSMLLALMFTMILSKQYRYKILLVSAYAFPAGIALTLVYPELGSTDIGFWNLFNTPKNIEDLPDINSLSSGRIDFWFLAIENIQRHPILGHGVFSFSHFAQTQFDVNQVHIHNSYLEYLHAGGLIAALCIFGAISFFYVKLLLVVRQSGDLILVATFSSITVTLVMALFDGVFVYFRPLLQTVILFAIINYHLRHSEQDGITDTMRAEIGKD